MITKILEKKVEIIEKALEKIGTPKYVEGMFIPEHFTDKRKFKNKVQYLVKWKDYNDPEWTYLTDLRTDTNKKHIDELIKEYENSK